MIETRIAWLGAVQILAVLMGHAAGIAGETWCKRVWDGALPPPVTSFYAHFGLWLLALPVLWFTCFMVNQKATNGRVPVSVWVSSGIVLIAGLAMFGGVALVGTMFVPISKWLH